LGGSLLCLVSSGMTAPQRAYYPIAQERKPPRDSPRGSATSNQKQRVALLRRTFLTDAWVSQGDRGTAGYKAVASSEQHSIAPNELAPPDQSIVTAKSRTVTGWRRSNR
jgi:hypothetical protein